MICVTIAVSNKQRLDGETHVIHIEGGRSFASARAVLTKRLGSSSKKRTNIF